MSHYTSPCHVSTPTAMSRQLILDNCKFKFGFKRNLKALFIHPCSVQGWNVLERDLNYNQGLNMLKIRNCVFLCQMKLKYFSKFRLYLHIKFQRAFEIHGKCEREKFLGKRHSECYENLLFSYSLSGQYEFVIQTRCLDSCSN